MNDQVRKSRATPVATPSADTARRGHQTAPATHAITTTGARLNPSRRNSGVTLGALGRLAVVSDGRAGRYSAATLALAAGFILLLVVDYGIFFVTGRYNNGYTFFAQLAGCFKTEPFVGAGD